MEIKITPEIKDEISSQLLEFVNNVIEKEALGRWAVHIWACRREGECDDTTIMFGPCDTEFKTKLLFLHEVAHALRSHIDWDDSYWHGEGWAGEFDRLCKEYLGITVNGCRELIHNGR